MPYSYIAAFGCAESHGGDGRLLIDETDDGAPVEATAEEHTDFERRPGHLVDGALEEANGLLNGLVQADFRDRFDVVPVPVTLQREGAVGGAMADHRAGRQHVYILKPGAFAEVLLEANVLGHGGGVELARHFGRGQNRFDLGGEDEGVADVGVEVLIQAQAVVDEKGFTCAAVPHGDDEGTIEAGEAGDLFAQIDIKRERGIVGA